MAMKKLKQIRNMLSLDKPVLKRRYKVSRLGIFGSYSRGEEKKTSDVDILVRFNQDATLFDFVGLGNYLEERLHMKVDIVSENGIRPEFKENILKELVKV